MQEMTPQGGGGAIPPLVRMFSRDESSLTGIRITRAHSGQQRRLMNIQSREGFLVENGKVSPWRWNGTVESEGFLYATFPTTGESTGEVESLETLAEKSPDECAASIEQLLYAYTRVEESMEEGAEQGGPLAPEGIFFDGEGVWYFLPSPLSSIIAEETPSESRKTRFSGYDARKRIAGFSLYVLYRSITGHGPFEAAPEVAAHPYLYRPEIREELAELLHRPFFTGSIPELEEVAQSLSHLRSNSLYRSSEEEEKEERSHWARRELNREVKKNKWRQGIRQYAPPAALAIAALIVLLFFSPVGGEKRKDPTEGLTAREVARLYYKSISRLDHETMEACTRGNPGAQQMDEVTTLFVIRRIREGVERIEVFMSAEEWEERGRPSLQDHSFVYGIADLELEELSSDEEREVSFRARFLKYSTLPAEVPRDESLIEPTGTVEITEIVEHLLLEAGKAGNWKITEITREKRSVQERVGGSE